MLEFKLGCYTPAHATVPLSFQSVDPGHPPRLQSPTTLHPYVATKYKSYFYQEGARSFHSPVQSGT